MIKEPCKKFGQGKDVDWERQAGIQPWQGDGVDRAGHGDSVKAPQTVIHAAFTV